MGKKLDGYLKHVTDSTVVYTANQITGGITGDGFR
jgi:hypothetical protein